MLTLEFSYTDRHVKHKLVSLFGGCRDPDLWEEYCQGRWGTSPMTDISMVALRDGSGGYVALFSNWLRCVCPHFLDKRKADVPSELINEIIYINGWRFNSNVCGY